MNTRRLIIVFIAIGAILLVGAGAYVALSGGSNTPEPVATTANTVQQPAVQEGVATPLPIPVEVFGTAGPMRKVVVSLQTVPRGWRLTENELTLDDRPAADIGSNVITDIEDAIGMYARTDIYQGETLTFDALARDITANGAEKYGPSSLIPVNWVAMAIPMDRLASIGYGIDVGDSVDIMLSFQFDKIDEEFQTLFATSHVGVDSTGNTVIVDPFGYYEIGEDGNLRMIIPSENNRLRPVTVLLQNAKVIQVGPWVPPIPAATRTPTPDPNAATPTPGAGVPPTFTPQPPNVLLIALPPQQQLYLKYALENNATIDYALRPANDGQIHAVQNVDLSFLLQEFNFEIPPNLNFIPYRGTPFSPTLTPTPFGTPAG